MTEMSDNVTDDYALLLERAIIHLRYRIHYDDAVTVSEVHDFLDLLHNIPPMLRGVGGWHTPANINVDLKRYDDKWLSVDDGAERRRGLLDLLQDIRSRDEDSHGSTG